MDRLEGARGNVVELRVHGVSGTPPEELLDRRLVRQVAGDKTAGFYRPRLREEWRDRPSNDPATDAAPYAIGAHPPPPPLLEGYCWGGLTSGSPSRSLWLILLPFTLINVAPRMRPVPGRTPEDHPGSAWWVWFLSRVMAVSLTVTLTLGATGIGLAILAWQCVDTCQNLPWPLSAMFLSGSPGSRVLWGASLPLTVLALLALLSWRKSVQYDLIRPIGMDEPVDGVAESGSMSEPRLGNPSFWYGRYPVSRLRHLHLQAGVGIVGFSLVDASASSTWRSVGVGLGVAITVLLLGGLAWPGLLRRADIPGKHEALVPRLTRYRNIGWILLIWPPVIAILVLGLALPHAADGEMAGYDELVTLWFAGQSVLTLVMFVLVAAMARAEPRRTPRRAMGGLGAVALTILALYIGAAMTSGFVILSAAWITSSTPWISIADVQDLLLPSSPIEVPNSLQYAGFGTFVVAVIVTVVGLLSACYVGWMWVAGGTAADHRHAAEAAARAEAEQPQRFARHRVSTIARRRVMIARSIWLARRADFLPGRLAVLVLTIGLAGSVLTIVYGVVVGLDSTVIAGRQISFPSFVGLAPVNPVAIGVWLIGVLTVAVILLSALAFRIPRTRKAVGIVWDLGSFWPRDVHPLAPPCYAERAVPELAMRLAEHAAMVSSTGSDAPVADRAGTPESGDAETTGVDRGDATGADGVETTGADRGDAPGADGVETTGADRGGRPESGEPPAAGLVVLAGHSQGTVISMAALLGPARASAGRTALLTFGTVLRRLYARFFPLYFSDDAFRAMAQRLGEPEVPSEVGSAPVGGTGEPGSGGPEGGGAEPGDRRGGRVAGSGGARPDSAIALSGSLGGDPSAGPWGPTDPGLVSPSLRWRNLWRRTDYLGGRVGDPLADAAPPGGGPEGRVQIDVECVDPLFLPVIGDATLPAAGRHSNFPRDPEFQAQLMALVQASFDSLRLPSGGYRSVQPGEKPPTGADDLMNPRESMA